MLKWLPFTDGPTISQPSDGGLPFVLGTNYVLLHFVLDALLAVGIFALPVLVLRAAHLRPDLLDTQVGKVIAAFFASCALIHLTGLVAVWTSADIAYLILGILATCVCGYAIVQFIRLLPRYMTIPHVNLLADAHAEVEHQTHLAEDALAEADLQFHLTEEAQEQNRELDQFAYIASHDLREPLRGVAINADFLLRENLPKSAEKRVHRMIMLCNKMEVLIADLFKLSRLSSENRGQEIVNPTEVADEIVHSLTEVMEQGNAKVDVARDMPLVVGDMSKVRLVFHNLISNALKYNDSKLKSVEIGFLNVAKVNGQQLKDVFYIKDNGIGMEEKNLDKVFQIFSRLNTEKAYGPGTGAGLSFVKRIISDYGGTIKIISERGTGTTFYFSIPLSETSQERTSGG